MRIRRLIKTDIDEVSNLIQKTLCEVNRKDYSKKAIICLCRQYSPDGILLKSKEGITIVAAEDGKIIGTGSLKEDWISGVFVDPALHGQGIGKKMMGYLENLSTKNGFRKVKLGSSTTAVEFYRKIGYRKVKVAANKNLGKIVLMEKNI
jgi:ribosomal protein S18 acetylase RimI-like enzyme